ncbi:cysteine-rich venom protein TEL1 isoform X1 [Octopus sinensis]|uniref:Cysteine-rich venom protein TEL1 isoform X1 n=2 Tax=Octopus sinensis TaxID=2607531 RepID=A0A6P7U0H0_9MOLL|nr:cysteine-rich venom protein TEL1 isoform X1 [Octopus sinensis]
MLLLSVCFIFFLLTSASAQVRRKPGTSRRLLDKRDQMIRLPEDGSLQEALRRRGVFGQLSRSKFRPFEKGRILATHQKYREAINGANLLLMEWDESLASLAQGQADRCVFGPGNLFFLNGTNVGQNSVAVQGKLKPEEIVEIFQSQSSNYIYSTNSCKKGKNCEAYTQLIWYETNKVGCGQQFCDSLQFSDGTTKKQWWIYVCDYSPPGNYPEHPFFPSTYEACELCNLSPGTRCLQNQCKYCDPGLEPDCRPFNFTLCRSDKDPCCQNWDRQFCIPDTAYFNYMALNCGATCDSYMCLF